MKKSKIKRLVNLVLIKEYENIGLTNTADKVRKSIFRGLDKLYSK